MLRRGAAFAFAACILVWPAAAGSDTDTFWSTPSAAVLATATAPAFAPAQQPVAAVAANSLTENSGGKDEAPLQNASRAEAPMQAAAADMSETIILRPRPSPPAPALATQQVAAAAPADKSDSKDQAQAENNTRTDGSARMAALDPAQPESPLSPPPPRISEPFDLAATPISFGEVVAKWQGVEIENSRRRSNLRGLRQQQRSLPAGGTEFSCHRCARPGANRPGPHRRHQPRRQHGDRADERHGAMGGARSLEPAA